MPEHKIEFENQRVTMWAEWKRLRLEDTESGAPIVDPFEVRVLFVDDVPLARVALAGASSGFWRWETAGVNGTVRGLEKAKERAENAIRRAMEIGTQNEGTEAAQLLEEWRIRTDENRE